MLTSPGQPLRGYDSVARRYCTVALTSSSHAAEHKALALRALVVYILLRLVALLATMGKRPRVPAALHTEISEYSALLRALRNQETLDLTSQLIRAHSSSALAPEDDLLEDEDFLVDEGKSEHTEPMSQVTFTGGFFADEAPQSSKRKQPSGKCKPKMTDPMKPRDTWTRWPLLAGDLHVPQWTLEDEVKTLAVARMKRILVGPDAPAGAAALLNDLDDDFVNTLLPSASLDALTDDAASHLARILALVAAHRPPAAESMQNRFAPFGWEMIMAAVSSSGLVDAKFV